MRRGDVLPVRDSYPYWLPPGLKAGILVKLVEFDHGYWTVEANGQRFTLYLTAIDSGMEYEWRGRWLSAHDPRVIAERQETRLSKKKYPWMNTDSLPPTFELAIHHRNDG